jgi:Uma2 family endonuclease
MSVLHWPAKIDENLLFEISQANPGKFELTADGTLLMTPPTGSTGSLGEASIYDQVKAWTNTNDPEGFVLPPSGGFTLPDDGKWSPDTTYISADTYDNASDDDLARRYWRLVPNAVFELMSEGDRIGSKKYSLELQAYNDNALPLVVVIDPKERRTLTSRDCQPFVESFDFVLDLGSHMPGFVLDVGAVFAAEDRPRKRIRRSS